MTVKLKVKKSRGAKRKKLKAALKSAGGKVINIAKSRFATRFIPLFVLIVVFSPTGKAHALVINDLPLESFGEYGKNGTLAYIGYEGMRRVVSQGVAAIPDPSVRSVVSTTGSISAMVGGVICGMSGAVCAGMGYERKAMVCTQGVAICAGIATGLNEADPTNVATLPGALLAETARSAASMA